MKSIHKIIFVNHFAGIPQLNERSLRHFIIAKNIKSKIEPIIITSQKNYQTNNNVKYPNNEIVEIEGINYIFIKERTFKKINLFTKFLRMTSFSFNLFIFFLFKLRIKNVKCVYSSSPDLFSSLAAHYYAKKVGAKHFFEIRDIWPLSQEVLHGFNSKNLIIRLLRFIELYLYKNVDYIISPLKNLNIYLNEIQIDTPFKYLPQTFFPYDQNISGKNLIDFSLEEFDRIGVYAGSVGSFFKVENIIDFFPKNFCNKTAIFIIGDGDAFDRLENKVKLLNIKNIFIMKTLTHDNLSYIYNIADFAIASYPDKDSLFQFGHCPLKIYDYMYHKLPIIFIGNKYNLDIESAGIFQVKFDNRESFSKIINKVNLMSKDELKSIGLMNYDCVNRTNSPENLIKGFNELIFH